MTKLEAARRFLHLSDKYVASCIGVPCAIYRQMESAHITVLTSEQRAMLEKVLFVSDDMFDEYHEPTEEEILLNFKKMMLDKQREMCYTKSMKGE